MSSEAESFSLKTSPLPSAVRSGARALVWLQIASQVISVLGLAILMRFLAPADYGLVGMVVPIVLFLRIFTTLGLPMATVQRRQPKGEETSALFWWNVLFGCATAVLTVAIAPWVARFYNQPALERPLTQLMVALAATSILAAWGTQHQALLERKLQFGRVSVARLLGQVGGTVAAIAAAVAGWGAWALVVQQYVELLLITALVWYCEPWRPARPRLDRRVAGILRWGGLLASSSVVFFVGLHFDRLLVGRLVGPEAVGLYVQASNLMFKPVYLVSTPLAALMLTSLSRAVDQHRFREDLLLAYYRLVAIVITPACLGLALVSHDVMFLLGGEKWTAAGPILQALALGMLGHVIIILAGPVLTAAGRTGALFACSLALMSLLIASELIGWWIGSRYGRPTLGIAWAATVAISLIIALPYTVFCLRTAGYRVLPVIAILARPAQAAVVMAMFVWMTGQWLSGAPPVVRVVVQIGVGILVYGTVARDELSWLWRHWRHDLRPPKSADDADERESRSAAG